MTKRVNKTQPGKLVHPAPDAQQIAVAKAGKPVARPAQLEQRKVRRVPGQWKGRIWVAPDFDDPLPPEILAAFNGERD
jgi:antitoxin (DNA-binding transcriptional repressor) of toxin-antitoxin stability system